MILGQEAEVFAKNGIAISEWRPTRRRGGGAGTMPGTARTRS